MAHGPARPHRVQLAEFHFEHVAIKKQQGPERLVLGAGGNLVGGGQVRQVSLDLLGSHGIGMFDAMEENESANPLAVTPFGG